MLLPTYPYGNHIGEKFGHLLAVGAFETDGENGDPVIYDCTCTKCGREHLRVLDRDLLAYKVRCCEHCDRNDLTGMTFGRWTVLEFAGHNKFGQKTWKCKCECGTIRIISGDLLLSRKSRSCGCLQREIVSKVNFKDLTGKKFGRLTVIRRVENRPRSPSGKAGNTRYECKCECGKTVVVDGGSLNSGVIKSCGCLKAEYASKLNFKDLTGQKFGRLTVIERDSRTGECVYWKCKCECGNEIVVPSGSLISGHTKSCGCFSRESAAIRLTKWAPDELPIIKRFHGMTTRCYNKNNPRYPNYGGRGIVVCDEWLKDPRKFVDWAKSHGFRQDLSIDRIDVNGPYSPDNCRWADIYTQASNKQRSSSIQISKVKHLISKWAEETGQSYESLFDRLTSSHEFFTKYDIVNLKNH